MGKDNIILVGFMGTGKSTVGKRISADLGMEYVDTDLLIEKRERRTINDIFETMGEGYFRTVEKEVVKEVSRKTQAVIDTGGGVVLDDGNIRNLKAGGTVFCLTASAENVYKRTKDHGHRPLLNVDDPIGKIEGLLKSRRRFYMKADYRVVTDDRDPKAVAGEIEEIYMRGRAR